MKISIIGCTSFFCDGCNSVEQDPNSGVKITVGGTVHLSLSCFLRYISHIPETHTTTLVQWIIDERLGVIKSRDGIHYMYLAKLGIIRYSDIPVSISQNLRFSNNTSDYTKFQADNIKSIFCRWRLLENFCPDHLTFIQRYMKEILDVTKMPIPKTLCQLQFENIFGTEDPLDQDSADIVHLNMCSRVFSSHLIGIASKDIISVAKYYISRIQLATAEPEKCYIDLLTQDVLSQIMYFLDPLDVFQCVRVCKQFKLAAQHGSMSLPKVRMGDLVTTVLPEYTPSKANVFYRISECLSKYRNITELDVNVLNMLMGPLFSAVNRELDVAMWRYVRKLKLRICNGIKFFCSKQDPGEWKVREMDLTIFSETQQVLDRLLMNLPLEKFNTFHLRESNTGNTKGKRLQIPIELFNRLSTCTTLALYGLASPHPFRNPKNEPFRLGMLKVFKLWLGGQKVPKETISIVLSKLPNIQNLHEISIHTFNFHITESVLISLENLRKLKISVARPDPGSSNDVKQIQAVSDAISRLSHLSVLHIEVETIPYTNQEAYGNLYHYLDSLVSAICKCKRLQALGLGICINTKLIERLFSELNLESLYVEWSANAMLPISSTIKFLYLNIFIGSINNVRSLSQFPLLEEIHVLSASSFDYSSTDDYSIAEDLIKMNAQQKDSAEKCWPKIRTVGIESKYISDQQARQALEELIYSASNRRVNIVRSSLLNILDAEIYNIK